MNSSRPSLVHLPAPQRINIPPEIHFPYFVGKIVRKIVWKFISIFFWLLLLAMGWHFLDEKELRRVKSSKKSIVVFSHTSYWDFWLIAMHAFAFPGMMENVYTVMKPQPFKTIWGPLLRSWRVIPATKLEESGKGFVEDTIKLMEEQEIALLMISPEGKLAASEWRSGYYHIAKKMNIPLITVGFDYSIKKLVTLEFRDHEDYPDKKTMEDRLKKDMGAIVPLNRSQSFVDVVKDHNPIDVSPVDPILLSNLLPAIPGLYYVYFINFWLFLHGLVAMIVSLKYHYDYESNSWIKFLDFWIASFFVGHGIFLKSHSYSGDLILILMGLICFLIYLKASGRHDQGKLRRQKYVFYHSCFHLCIGIAIIYACFNESPITHGQVLNRLIYKMYE